jgi:hypothetical protein
VSPLTVHKRRAISFETWQQIKTAYASGIGLREIARNMNIPEGTVLAHAKRHGWTQQIQVATRDLAVMQSDAIAPVQSVPLSVAAILAERKERTKLGLSKFTAEAAEQAAEHRDKLGIAGKVRDVAGVHKTLWPEENRREEIINLAIVTGAFQPLPVNPNNDAQLGEMLPDVDERERKPVLGSRSTLKPTDLLVAREDNAGASAEDPLASKNARLAESRLAFERRCMHWRSERGA